MKRIIKRNKNKISRAFKDDLAARKSINAPLDGRRRHYYHYLFTGEYVWVY
jgi:hypothetical protein